MKNLITYILTTAFAATLMIGFTQTTHANDTLTTTQTHIKFFSTTPVEDIESNNFNATSTINTETGEVIFVVPMQSFEFEKSLMQRHFNQKKFLNTRDFPRARYVATITNLQEINFTTDGTYTAHVEGEMTIRGETNPLKEQASVIVSNGTVTVNSIFPITLAEYGIEFSKGKPSRNIAKTVEVTVIAEYQFEQ